MDRLFKAITGFAIAFYVWSPAGFAAHFDTPAVASLRTQIEAAHPHAKLAVQWADVNARLKTSAR